MQTIILTIKSHHLGNIRRGCKLYELRKNIPACVPPFKVLLCESGSGGQIKAEFVCDQVHRFSYFSISEIAEKCCLSCDEVREYLTDSKGYLWHISKMIDYCTTKNHRIRNISEYGLKRVPQSWVYVEEMMKE